MKYLFVVVFGILLSRVDAMTLASEEGGEPLTIEKQVHALDNGFEKYVLALSEVQNLTKEVDVLESEKANLEKGLVVLQEKQKELLKSKGNYLDKVMAAVNEEKKDSTV